MGAGIATGALIGGGSLLSSGLNAFSTNHANKANAALTREQMQWQTEEAEKNRNFQDAQRVQQNVWQEDQYLKYSSPSAMVSQMKDAGINPAAVLAGGSSGVVQPFQGSGGAVGSGSMPGTLVIPSQQAARFDNIAAGVGSFIKDVAEAKKLGADTSRIEKLTNEEFNNWVLKNQGEEIANAAKTIELDILNSTKDTRVRSALVDLQNSIMDGYLKGDQYDLNQLEKRFKHLNNLLAAENIGIKHEEKLQLAWKTKYMEQIILGDLKEQRSRTAANYASARDLSASAEGKELLNNISRATNLTDIENALFKSDVIDFLKNANNKEEIWQQLQRNIYASKAYKNGDMSKQIETVLERLSKSIGINVGVSN